MDLRTAIIPVKNRTGRRRGRMLGIALLVAGLVVFQQTLAAESLSEEAKINLLIQTVENSANTFIRGGSEHSARDAASHMRMKWKRAGKGRIDTARKFIKYVASESYLLGTPYYIKFPDGRKIRSRDYLLARLGEIEAQ